MGGDAPIVLERPAEARPRDMALHALFPEGGDMGAELRAHDWSHSPLGEPQTWPVALRNALNLMLNSPESMYIVWGKDLTFFFNDTYRPILGPRLDGALGQPLHVLWADAFEAVREPLEKALNGTASRFVDVPITMARRGEPEQTWWSYSYSPLYDGDQIGGVFCHTTEKTEHVLADRAAEAAIGRLAEREAFLSDVLSASTDCIQVLELDGTVSFISEGGMRVMEISDLNAVQGRYFPSLLSGAGSGRAEEALKVARAGKTAHFEAEAFTGSGKAKWLSVSVSPILGEDGHVARILSVSRNHTALKEARERQRLLNGELGHRVKNLLSLVQSIANQTLQYADDMNEGIAAFSARLASVGQATELLTATEWEQANLHAVAKAGLMSFDSFGDRISISGPPIELGPQVAVALTLALHELAANAVKYGALSGPTGRVELAWKILHGADGEARFHLRWRETGGPVVQRPARRGFGSRMIERSLRAHFGGAAALTFEPSGVEFRIDAPLGDAVKARGE